MPAHTGIGSDVVLTLQVGQGAATRQRHLARGGSLRFHGCQTGCCPTADLQVPGAAGTVRADRTSWQIVNDSAATPLRVWSLESPHDQVRVAPGAAVSPPFDLAGVAGAAGQVFTVFGPEAAPPTRAHCVSAVRPAWGLDPASRRHDVMITLVAPRLAGDPTAPLPTAEAIGRQLGMSPRTVQEHLRAVAATLGITLESRPKPGSLQNALGLYALNHHYVPADRPARPFAPGEGRHPVRVPM